MQEIRLIKSFEDALKVRKIRNECAAFMTQDVNKISLLQQANWWFKIYKPQHAKGVLDVFLFLQDNVPIGYGLIRLEEHSVISGGLSKNARGKGAGRKLFQFLTDYAGMMYPEYRPVTLEVLVTNEPAHALYQKLGFEDISFKKNIISMEKRYAK